MLMAVYYYHSLFYSATYIEIKMGLLGTKMGFSWIWSGRKWDFDVKYKGGYHISTMIRSVSYIQLYQLEKALDK